MIFPDIPSSTARARAFSETDIAEADRVTEEDSAKVRASIHAASIGAYLDCAAPHHHDHHHVHHDHGHADSHAHDHHHVDESAHDPTDMGIIVSGGNFHGEYPAKMLDFLAIAVSELASVAERRIERLVNPHLSGLPAFLVKQGGLNSGFMIAHCTAAALVSENKVLCHPSSVDSLSTSAAQEDHVSMGGMSARKALEVVKNVEHVLAIEMLAAVQALEFSGPLRTTGLSELRIPSPPSFKFLLVGFLLSSAPLEAVHRLVRSVVAPYDHDRFMAPDIEASVNLLRSNKVWDAVLPWLSESKQ
jgi:histidine ammonia-lyase